MLVPLVLAMVLPACRERRLARSGTLAQPAASGGGGFLGSALPGAQPIDGETLRQLKAAWKERDPAYEPRTRHLNGDGSPKYTNRLFLESSPYLLQHAHNPTNWSPWGDEAFARAKALGRPVLLSVGYSTCHWCHVMEEESFEDEEIARILNENYIVIKVDREERPDVDSVYMKAVHLIAGSGGWPMTVWLTADRKPYYGGTYFPARDGDRGAGVGFLTLLHKLKKIHDEQPERVASTSTQITQSIRASLSSRPPGTGPLGSGVLHALAAYYRLLFDEHYGGLNRAPKFPSSLSVRFLLRYHRRTKDPKALEMVTTTLEMMAAGGMYDQVGGGFHRYSTDAQWLVPHFEKMLYDNALLTLAYLEAYQVTGREDFARVAREILRYVQRDMTASEGAFYSATDADSLSPSGHREEGWFFTWTPAEIDAALDEGDARLVKAYYDVTARGNFEGRSILHTFRPLDEIADELKLAPDEARRRLDAARDRLYQVRSRRPAPLRDEKIIAAWNGLMISAYAQGALVLNDAAYAERAAAAAEFVLTHLRKDGRLLRTYMNGRARHNAYLDDYAFVTAGLLDLYEATGERRWLEEAVALDAVLEEHYEDRRDGGFFLTSDDHEVLLAREKPGYDGAEPSGNSVHALNLLRLHEFTTQDRYRQRAEATIAAFHAVLDRSPAALSEMLLAVDYHLDTPKEVVIVTPSSRAEAEPFLSKLRKTFLPNRVLSVVSEGELERLSRLVPLVAQKKALRGRPTAYVCEKRVCELPTSDPEVFARQIAKTRPLSAGGRTP